MKLILTIVTLILATASLAAANPRLTLVIGDQTPERKLNSPFAIQFDKAGAIYIAEAANTRILKLDVKNLLTTIAGTGENGFTGDDGPAVDAKLNGTHSIAMSPNGDLYIADTYNCRIRRIDTTTHKIHTFAGTGEKGFSGDEGPAAKARFGDIYCVAFDPKAEHMYVADLDNRRIRAIDMKTNIVTTIAGTGKKAIPDDGAEAKSSPLFHPRAVAADDHANVYILESNGNALRVIDPAGKIRTLAGTGKPGLSDGDGDPRKAQLNGPKHLCLDADGNLLIADTENNMIRRYLVKENKIVPVVGTGKKGNAGLDGPPDLAELNRPHGVWLGPDGDIYIADSGNDRIVKFTK